MDLLTRVVLGGLVIAHGLVHLLYFIPETDDKDDFPFSLRRSWMIPAGLRRPGALALAGGTVVGFLVAGLAVWGLPGLTSVWPVATVAGAAASLLMLLAFWNARLLAGIAIDVVLVMAVVVRPEWVDPLVS